MAMGRARWSGMDREVGVDGLRQRRDDGAALSRVIGGSCAGD